MADPRSVYSGLLDQRCAEISRREMRQRRLGYGRLACVGAAIMAVWQALAMHRISILWLALPIVVFVVLLVIHERHERLTGRLRRAERYFRRGLTRLDNTWAGGGEPGDRYLDPAHPYALDLDLFGKGSLFDLL